MKIRIQRDELLSALKNTLPFCYSKKNPVLENLLIEAKGKQIDITGTEIETSIKCIVDCDVETEGKILFNAQKLTGIVETMGKFIDIDECQIISDDTKVVMPIFDLQSYPDVLTKEYTQKIEIPSDILINGLSKTLTTISTIDNSNNLLSGINIVLENNQICFYSTDGNIAGSYKEELITKENFDIIIPIDSVKKMLKILKDNQELILSTDEKSFAIKSNNFIFNSRLLVGIFPKVEQFLNQEKEYNFVINREYFSNVIKKCRILKENKKGEVNYFKLNLQNARLDIGYKTILTDTTLVENTGNDMILGLDFDYLENGLKNILSENIKVEYQSNQQGLRIIENNYTFLIMPIQIKSF